MAAARILPKVHRKLVAVSLSNRFRDAVQLQTAETPRPGRGELLVRVRHVGINASDINWTAGRYVPGIQPPMDVGFEGLGEVAAVGEKCEAFKPGDVVGFMQSVGAFSEYFLLRARHALPMARLDPALIPLMVSGLTASISLERMADMKAGEKVLVTAAAGGTGQFAVQLAKLAGCHVIGTCSTDDKVAFLRRIGCDRPINYKKEDVKAVLKEEYPDGVDVVYEGVGGDLFNTCVKNLSIGGRLIIIGFIASYQQSTFSSRITVPLHQILLSKSASLHGFFLNNHSRDIPRHLSQLIELYTQGKIQSTIDVGERAPSGPFRGLEAIFDAVDYLYSGKSAGKVVVSVTPDSSKL